MKDLLDSPPTSGREAITHQQFFFEPDIKTDEDLADYYRHQLGKSTSAKDVLFFIKGLMSLLKIQLDADALYQRVRERLTFFRATGYTLQDMARHCGVSEAVISKVLNNKDITVNYVLVLGYQLVPDCKRQLLKD